MRYTYKCIKCKRKFDETMTVQEYDSNAAVSRVCPYCNTKTGFRAIDRPTIIFKGNGFYSTDSRKKGHENSSSTS
jgi:predicted nucleic acid-binding Zn ribbon protein